MGDGSKKFLSGVHVHNSHGIAIIEFFADGVAGNQLILNKEKRTQYNF